MTEEEAKRTAWELVREFVIGFDGDPETDGPPGLSKLTGAIAQALLKASQPLWREIEEAEKDGTEYLVYGEPDGEIHGPFGEKMATVASSSGGAWSVTATDAYSVTVNATHFMPLPNPPKGK